jgi:hypothetical protein
VRHVSACLLLLLAACGTDQAAPQAPRQDEKLARHEEAGRIAYGLDRPEEAVAEFQAGLKQAQARDDLAAISDLSFNLAVAQLGANRPQDALTTAVQARAELSRRGSAPFPALSLVEATALYRLGQRAKADALAAQIQSSNDRDAAAGASFLRGLIADDAVNMAGLRDALAQLSNATEPLQRADRLELQARLAARQEDFSGAHAAALQAADIRQQTLDYRGMARALGISAAAAERSGDRERAADLYLRAGRSAAAQLDAETARPWLERALSLTRDSSTRDAAELALSQLDESS